MKTTKNARRHISPPSPSSLAALGQAGIEDASPRTNGARRCTNPECEYGRGGSSDGWSCSRTAGSCADGRGCHTIYDAAEVINPENDDYWLLVSRR